MAIKRQQNWLGQQRVDVSDLRSVESAVSNDFDILGGKVMSGRQPMVMRGLTISTTTAAGNAADSLQISVAGALLMHFGASESGTVFSVDDNQPAEVLSANNGKVSGSFTAGSTNYIGLDLRRSADATTTDLKQFLDADSDTEIPKSVPTARTLQYQILISTIPFSVSSNICPIAKVVTDSSNLVQTITDARPMMFRLAVGGDNPNSLSSYAWRDSGRREGNVTFNPPTFNVDPFSKGDKDILSLKEWMDAMMSVLWEAKSGEFWYSPTARDGAKMMFGSPVFVATGDNFIWTGGSSTLQWQSLAIAFENSTGYYNVIQDGSAVIASDGMCLYVDLQRGTNGATIIPAVGNLTSLGTPNIPGSRYIIAWRQNGLMHVRDKAYEVGRNFPIATTSTTGDVKLSRTASTPSTPIVISDGGGTIIAPAGSNNTGIIVTGDGTGYGGKFVAGSSGTTNGIVVLQNGASDPGVLAAAGVFTGSIGIISTSNGGGNAIFSNAGTGSGYGLRAIGGTTATAGVNSTAGTGSNGSGIIATGDGNGAGGTFTSGTGNADGAAGSGHGTGVGVRGFGGNGTVSIIGQGSGGYFTGGTHGSGVVGIGLIGAEFYGPTAGGGIGLFVQGSYDGTGNAIGGSFVGVGTQSGVVVQGGATAFQAMLVTAVDTVFGNGIIANSAGPGSGVTGNGTGTNGVGVTGVGGFTGTGVVGTGGNGGNGGVFTGTGNAGKGIVATGGNSSNITNHGVVANGGGTTSSSGIVATGAPTGIGGVFNGGSTSGLAGKFSGANNGNDVVQVDGMINLHNGGVISSTGSGAGGGGRVTRSNIVQCWITGTISSSAMTTDDSFNCSSGSVSSNTIVINLGVNMADTKYAVHVTVSGAYAPLWSLISKTTTTVTLTSANKSLDTTAGSFVTTDWSTQSFKINVTIVGTDG